MRLSYQQAHQHAQNLMARGKRLDAIDFIRKFLASTKVTPIMLHNYASLLGDCGCHGQAVEICKKAFAKGLDAPETWLVYARSLQAIGNFEDAEKAFETVLIKNSYDLAAQRDFAQFIWMRTSNRNDTLKRIDEDINNRPDNFGLKLIRAQVIGFMGGAEEEYEILKALINVNGPADESWGFLLNAACNAGEYKVALDLALTGINQVGDRLGFRPFVVQALLAMGEATKAMVHIDLLLKVSPKNQHYIALYATALRMSEREEVEIFFDYENLVRGYELSTPKGWSSLELYLKELVEVLDELHNFKAHPFGLSLRYGSQIASIELMDHPALKAFNAAAQAPLNNYMAHLQNMYADKGPLGVTSNRHPSLWAAWSVSLPPGGFHVSHNHPQGWLSSACHIRKVNDNNDMRAGWLKFGEAGIATKPKQEAQYFVEPKKGTMVLFPSYLWHGTIGFDKGPSRVTIAADFV